MQVWAGAFLVDYHPPEKGRRGEMRRSAVAYFQECVGGRKTLLTGAEEARATALEALADGASAGKEVPWAKPRAVGQAEGRCRAR